MTTEQHKRILDLTAQGMSAEEVAQVVDVSPTTVKKWRQITPSGELPPAALDSRLRRQNEELKHRCTELERQISEYSIAREFMAQTAQRVSMTPVPEWVTEPKKRRGVTSVTPHLLISDAHRGDVIKPEQVGGCNSHNPQISDLRHRKLVDGFIRQAKERLSGYNYGGVVVSLLGDMFSGDIHHELMRTNSASIQDEVCNYLAPMCSALTHFAEEFGRVLVPTAVGNHSRSTLKPVSKDRAHTNFDRMFYRLLQQMLQGDKRITILIPEAADMLYSVQGTTFLATHGDRAKGGGGDLGPLGALLKLHKDTKARQRQINQPYDVLTVGHYHRATPYGIGRDCILLNGTIRGFDEYCFNSGYAYEPPRQLYCLIHPRHGVLLPGFIDCTHPDEKKYW
jgi:transposase